jgi:AcrR family transcriptional regulator
VGRREQAEASRTALVTAARTAFVESGYEATTVAHVLREAGMARGALYHYFPDGKLQLFAEVYEQVNEQLYREVGRIPASPSALGRIRQITSIFLRLCCRPDFGRIAVLEGPRVLPRAEVSRSYTGLRSDVAQAVADGELVDVDVDTLATALYAACRDLGARIAAARSPRRTAVEATTVVERLLDGLSAPVCVGAAALRSEDPA